MRNRLAITEQMGFQRLLWLAIGTVVIPTVILSLYGSVAIRHQQTLLKDQLRLQHEERLAYGAATLLREIANAEDDLWSSIAACDAEVPCAEQGAGWRITNADPNSTARTKGRTPSTWRAASDSTIPRGTFYARGYAIEWEPDVTHLRAALQQRSAERFADGTEMTIVEPGREATTLEEVLDRWMPPLPTERTLDAPLTGWRLKLSWPASKATAAIMDKTAWLAPAGLLALVGLILIGTLITLLSARRLIRLSELQSDFVSSISHELRTPLTSIRLFVDTLESGRIEDPARVKECLTILGQETDRLSRRIERVLNWAKMEAGKRRYDLVPVSSEQLFRDALVALQTQRLLDPTQDIDVALPAPVPWVLADADAVVEALLNLLQNAVRYCPPPRSILLTVSMSNGKVGLSVEDDGPGIPSEQRERIFERFYRGDAHKPRNKQRGGDQGSGLGLAIVQAVVTGHGGTVELATETGKGSRFTLWLRQSPAPDYAGDRQ